VTFLKIVVFSDSHHATREMIDVVEAEHPDLVIHLGDLQRDAEALAAVYPKLPLVSVPGNCDGWTDQPVQKLITVQHRRILLSHGHIWHVKSGYDLAFDAAIKAGAHILLFGHTHRSYCCQREQFLAVNPGASRSSYARLTLSYDQLQGAIIQITNSC